MIPGGMHIAHDTMGDTWDTRAGYLISGGDTHDTMRIHRIPEGGGGE